jgi:hypothetical protein
MAISRFVIIPVWRIDLSGFVIVFSSFKGIDGKSSARVRVIFALLKGGSVSVMKDEMKVFLS